MCAVVLALTSAGIAHATTRVKVIGTFPAGDAITLGRNQNFHRHLANTSDRPVQIWARPYFAGKAANAGSNASRSYPAGSGEAMGWFFLFDPGTRVDEVRVSAGDGSTQGTQVVATYPVSVTGGEEPVQVSPPPAWVSTLNAADYEKRTKTPPSSG